MEITRGFTLTKQLRLAQYYIKKKYKRTEIEKAEKDLDEWIENNKKVFPVM